jgi:hypothetical protein
MSNFCPDSQIGSSSVSDRKVTIAVRLALEAVLALTAWMWDRSW